MHFQSIPMQSIVASDVMIPLGRLITLRPEMSAVDAMQLLLKNRISGAPVVDEENSFLGVFSEKTSMKFLLRLIYENLPSSNVSSFMNTDRDRTIHENTDLLTIVDLFLQTPYRRLPVLSDDKLIGQVSRRDAIAGAMKLLDRCSDNRKKLLYLSALNRVDEAVARF